jgi:hypothetical protein
MFLFEILHSVTTKERLWGRWLGWIKKILTRGSVGVTINNMEGEFFQTRKGIK